MKKRLFAVLALMLLTMGVGSPVLAQSPEGYSARLSPAPTIGVSRDDVEGAIGSAVAELDGGELVVAGSFTGLASAAIGAHIYIGPVTGVRGDPVFDLTIVQGADQSSGGLSGTLDLTSDQVEALRDGRFHIQVLSEGVPEGHLLGWLLR